MKDIRRTLRQEPIPFQEVLLNVDLELLSIEDSGNAANQVETQETKRDPGSELSEEKIYCEIQDHTGGYIAEAKTIFTFFRLKIRK